MRCVKLRVWPAIKRFISSELAFHACEESEIVYWKFKASFHFVRNLFSRLDVDVLRGSMACHFPSTIPNIMASWWGGGGVAADMLGAKFGWPSFSISCRFVLNAFAYLSSVI